MKPIRLFAAAFLLSGLLCGCQKITAPAVTEDATTGPQQEAILESESVTPVPEDPVAGFQEIIDRYSSALQEKSNPAQMMEQGLNYMIAGCLEQDERAQVGYFLGDINNDGEEELAVAASSESVFYTGLVFELYGLEDGKPVLLLDSSERNRWYYAGDGKLLNISSSGAAESGWYLCSADQELKYLDAVECNAIQYPDDPWLQFTADGWEHIDEGTASQKIMELECMVSNLPISPFSD